LEDERFESEADATLVARAISGDRDAFERLVRRHLRVAHAVARRHVANGADADDVVQDAFLKALQRLEDCRNPEHFRAWLLTIVRNRAHNVRAREHVRATEPLDSVDAVSNAPDPGRGVEDRELGEAVEVAMGALTDLQRNVFVLHDMEGLDHGEVASRLGLSRASSRFNLHVARKALRDRLSSHAGTLAWRR
jgi:RNA polymerase sigma-70 factor (ECF subfamily)